MLTSDIKIKLKTLLCGQLDERDHDEPYLWVLYFKMGNETIDPNGSGMRVPYFYPANEDPGEALPSYKNWEVSSGSRRTIPSSIGEFHTRVEPLSEANSQAVVGFVAVLIEADESSDADREKAYDVFKSMGPLLARIELPYPFGPGIVPQAGIVQLFKDAIVGAMNDKLDGFLLDADDIIDIGVAVQAIDFTHIEGKTLEYDKTRAVQGMWLTAFPDSFAEYSIDYDIEVRPAADIRAHSGAHVRDSRSRGTSYDHLLLIRDEQLHHFKIQVNTFFREERFLGQTSYDFPWALEHIIDRGPMVPIDLSLVQSNYGAAGNELENLELIVRARPVSNSPDRLLHYSYDLSGKRWGNPRDLVIDGVVPEGFTGRPAFIQTSFGARGDFLVLAPQDEAVAVYVRRNDREERWQSLGIILPPLGMPPPIDVDQGPWRPTSCSVLETWVPGPGRGSLLCAAICYHAINSTGVVVDSFVAYSEARGIDAPWSRPVIIRALGANERAPGRVRCNASPALIQSLEGNAGEFLLFAGGPYTSKIYRWDPRFPGQPWLDRGERGQILGGSRDGLLATVTGVSVLYGTVYPVVAPGFPMDTVGMIIAEIMKDIPGKTWLKLTAYEGPAWNRQYPGAQIYEPNSSRDVLYGVGGF